MNNAMITDAIDLANTVPQHVLFAALCASAVFQAREFLEDVNVTEGHPVTRKILKDQAHIMATDVMIDLVYDELVTRPRDMPVNGVSDLMQAVIDQLVDDVPQLRTLSARVPVYTVELVTL